MEKYRQIIAAAQKNQDELNLHIQKFEQLLRDVDQIKGQPNQLARQVREIAKSADEYTIKLSDVFARAIQQEEINISEKLVVFETQNNLFRKNVDRLTAVKPLDIFRKINDDLNTLLVETLEMNRREFQVTVTALGNTTEKLSGLSNDLSQLDLKREIISIEQLLEHLKLMISQYNGTILEIKDVCNAMVSGYGDLLNLVSEHHLESKVLLSESFNSIEGFGASRHNALVQKFDELHFGLKLLLKKVDETDTTVQTLKHQLLNLEADRSTQLRKFEEVILSQKRSEKSLNTLFVLALTTLVLVGIVLILKLV